MQPKRATERDLLTEAMAAQMDGRGADAIAAYQRILADDPDDVGARIGNALSHAMIGRHEDAFQDLLSMLRETVVQRDLEIEKLRRALEQAQIDARNPPENGKIDYDALYEQLYPRDVLVEKRFYNVGPGDFRHRRWTNVEKTTDAYDFDNVDIEYDILQRRPLSLPDDRAEAFYCSHVINLLPEDDIRFFLGDVFRCLKPGGFFRLVCIDAERMLNAYLDGDESFFSWHPVGEGPTIAQKFIGHVAGHRYQAATFAKTTKPTDAEIDALCRSGRPLPDILDALCCEIDLDLIERSPNNNVTWWTADKLTQALHDTGFSRVERSGIGQSRCPVMRDITYFDRNSVAKVSLYMEAQK